MDWLMKFVETKIEINESPKQTAHEGRRKKKKEKNQITNSINFVLLWFRATHTQSQCILLPRMEWWRSLTPWKSSSTWIWKLVSLWHIYPFTHTRARACTYEHRKCIVRFCVLLCGVWDCPVNWCVHYIDSMDSYRLERYVYFWGFLLKIVLEFLILHNLWGMNGWMIEVICFWCRKEILLRTFLCVPNLSSLISIEIDIELNYNIIMPIFYSVFSCCFSSFLLSIK